MHLHLQTRPRHALWMALNRAHRVIWDTTPSAHLVRPTYARAVVVRHARARHVQTTGRRHARCAMPAFTVFETRASRTYAVAAMAPQNRVPLARHTLRKCVPRVTAGITRKATFVRRMCARARTVPQRQTEHRRAHVMAHTCVQHATAASIPRAPHARPMFAPAKVVHHKLAHCAANTEPICAHPATKVTT